MRDTPLDRGRDNVTGIVSMLVTGFWLAAMFTGQDWWLAALLIGYVVVVPLTAILSGKDEATARADAETVDGSLDESATDKTALEQLRQRYASGELTDEQFERKLERLLETETLEDVEDDGPRVRETERN